MGILNKVVNLGTSSVEDNGLKTRIVSSNIVALLLAAIAGTYIPITYYFVEQLALIPILGVVIASVGLTLNGIKQHFLSRFLISIAPVTLPGIYHAYLVPATDPSLVPSVLITMGFSLIPFIVFRIKEYAGWVPGLIYGGFWVIGFDDFKNSLETAEVLDYSFIKSGFFQYLTSSMGFVFGAGGVFALSYLGYISEENNKETKLQMAASQKEMEESQAELQKTLEEIEVKKLEEEKRMWANDGMVKFSEILRNNTGEDLYAEIISEMVQYVGAKQGKVFKTLEIDGQPCLKLEGTYAYDRFKYEENEDGIIEMGEGLVGEAYKEGGIIHMTEIPDNYTAITSGLGEANPTAILIFPLMNEEVVEGIIELASFHEFAEFQIDFLSKVGINIATTFAREKINAQTSLLLEESKQQTEVMQQQEEEMRQNMEEMQATQDMMNSREQELLDEIGKLKKMLN